MILGDTEDDYGEAAEEEEEGSHACRTDWEEDEKHCKDASRSVRVLQCVTVHKCDLRDHQLEDTTALGDLEMAKTTASMYAIPSRIVAVEEKRRCREGCRKSL